LIFIAKNSIRLDQYKVKGQSAAGFGLWKVDKEELPDLNI